MKQKDIFYIVVSSFILIVIWIASNLWHIQNASKLTETVITQSLPITPSFDTKTLIKLKERTTAAPVFSTKPIASQAAILTPATTPTPTQSVVVSITPSPTQPSVTIAPTP